MKALDELIKRSVEVVPVRVTGTVSFIDRNFAIEVLRGDNWERLAPRYTFAEAQRSQVFFEEFLTVRIVVGAE